MLCRVLPCLNLCHWHTRHAHCCARREIQLLRKLNHKNVVKLKAVASNVPVAESGDVSSEIYFVLEYVEHDLAGILSASQHFPGGSSIPMCSDTPSSPPFPPAETKLSLGNIKHYAAQLINGMRWPYVVCCFQ